MQQPLLAMCEENHIKLWVIKFCLKVVFPKYNLYLFLVFLAVKYRLHLRKSKKNKELNLTNHMNVYKMRCAPFQLHTLLIQDPLELSKEKLSETQSNFLLVPYDSYVRLVTENPFYFDSGAVWVAMCLAPRLKDKIKQKYRNSDINKSLKLNLRQMKSDIHKKLWPCNAVEGYDRMRIVRVVPSKHLPQDVILVTENEEYNIKSCFGISYEESVIEMILKPVSSMEYVPQIASSVVIQMVLNPFDLSSDFITEILRNYFKSPRLIHIEDIFSIELTKEITSKYHYKYFDLVESTPKLYFKCYKINSDTDKSAKQLYQLDESVQAPFFIVQGKTELTLGENIHSMIPTHKHLTMNAARKVTSLIDACPFGLRRHFCRMQEAVMPFLADREGNLIHTSPASPIMPIFLLSGAVGSGRHLLVKILAKYNGLNCLSVDCNSIQSTTAKQTESKITSLIQKAKACSPVIVLMDNFEVFAVDAENNEDCRLLEYFHKITNNLFENYSKQPIILVAVTQRADLKPNILRIFLEKFHLKKPTNADRFAMLEWFVAAMQLNINDKIDEKEPTIDQMDIDLFDSSTNYVDDDVKEILQKFAAKTETFMYGDLDTLVHFALRNSFMKQHQNTISGKVLNEPVLEKVNEEDFSSALESIRALQSQHMDAPKIPKVYWEDIGGLDVLKKELMKTIEFPIKYPHLFKNSSLKRSGILLYGPPGCGKTLVAKAVSTELNVSFLSVKGPELLNMYIGQSEENVRKVFESARAASPCVVFLDELDALAPRRGAAGDSGGASDRVVSQLLAEIDGVAAGPEEDSSGMVFVMGATNRPDLLEQSLLRPGRLDKPVYVGPCRDARDKELVLRALCRREQLSEEVSLATVAAALPARCTGADLKRVVSVARAAAVRAVVRRLETGEARECERDSSKLVLGAAEMLEGVRRFKPSITDEEYAHYESLQL